MKKTTSLPERKYDTAYEVNQKLQTVSAELYKNNLQPVVGEFSLRLNSPIKNSSSNDWNNFQ